MRVPLRLRLTLAFTVGMVVVLAGLGGFLYVRVGHDLLNGIDMELRGRAQVQLAAIRERSTGLVPPQGELIDPDESFAQVLTPSGRIVDSSPAVKRAPMLTAARLRTVRGPTFFTAQLPGFDDAARLLAVRLHPAPGSDYVVVGDNLGDRHDALRQLLLELAIGGPVALAVVGTAGWAVARGALRPVERMRREAAAISLSEPGRRLAVPPTGDELARLAATLNDMLDRLGEAVQRKERFLDEASHELRTPLGVLRMELDLALARSRTPEELAAALRNASAETDRLVRLAEDLLVLSRTARGALPLHRSETAVGELMRRAAEANRAKAGTAGVELRCECDDGLTAVVDGERIRQALDDLLDNSLRQTAAGGEVTLSAERRDGRILIAVRDTGGGFPADVLAASEAGPNGEDPDGSDGTERADGMGPGLGLAIVGAIAHAHGGVLRLENPPGGGALATLDIPAGRAD